MYMNQFYGNQPYQNQFQQQFPNQQISQMQNQQNILSGRYVSNVDSIMPNDVPMGTYSIFPKSDMSEIYVKYWDKTGTIQDMVFREVEKEQEVAQPSFQEQLQTLKDEIMERFDKLEKPTRTRTKKESDGQ